MHTLRDFADSVGHIIRYTREYAFLTIGSIAQLEETLYEIPGIAQNLWTALAGESAGITLHSWRHMITMVLRNVVKYCPVRLLDSFLSEFLPAVLTKLDEVLLAKWERQRRLGLQLGDDYDIEEGGDTSNLSEEMMDEHLLRQLTAAVDRFLIDLSGGYGFQQQHHHHQQVAETPNSHAAVLRKVVFENKAILGPYMSLCKHIMLFRDYRCSFNCCVLVRNILPLIILRDPEVDNFLATEMMGACLEMLADPYFSDVHNEAGYIITTIYTTLRTQSREPFKNLADLLPGVSYQALSEFEVRLASAKSLRQQRGVFLEFLSLARVMDYGDQSDEAAREVLRRRAKQASDKTSLLKRKAKPGTDIIEEDSTSVATSMSVLFGE
jgi:exportin-5